MTGKETPEEQEPGMEAGLQGERKPGPASHLSTNLVGGDKEKVGGIQWHASRGLCECLQKGRCVLELSLSSHWANKPPLPAKCQATNCLLI